MAQANNPERINLNLINKLSHDIIIKHVSQHECTKNIVLSKDLIRIMDGVIKFSELKEHGVAKIYTLDLKMNREGSDRNMEWIYIVRPDIENVQSICQQIKADLKQNIAFNFPYKVLFAPRKLYTCELIFEQEGLYEYVVLGEIENDLIQLDSDIVSMEFPRFFTNYFLYGDQSWLPSIVKSLLNIQEWFGKIPIIHLHGTCAKSVYELMNRFDNMASTNDQIQSNSRMTMNNYKIGHLVLIDRNIDYVTPFCSPLTYEGLLDGCFKIDSNLIDLPETETVKAKRIKLSSEDKIFDEIRSMHITEVFDHLKNIISNMKSIQEKRNDLQDLSAIKEFINTDLKDYTKDKELLNLHLRLSEIIIAEKTHCNMQILSTEHDILMNSNYRKSYDYIEELINLNFNMTEVLRLMVLLSKTNDGLSSGDYNHLCQQFLQSYGYEQTILLQRLRSMRLFETSDTSAATNARDDTKSEFSAPRLLRATLPTQLKFNTNYGNLKKKLEINPGDLTKAQMKTDMSYAFNGNYRPILCRYISQMLFTEVKPKTSFDEIKKLFPGDYELITRARSVRNENRSGPGADFIPEWDRTVLIYFLGGCTYSEIAILKRLAAQKGRRFLFATTSFLNANTMINLFQP